jgi:hypothetical protein
MSVVTTEPETSVELRHGEGCIRRRAMHGPESLIPLKGALCRKQSKL